MFGLLSEDSKKTFQKLDGEFAFDMNCEEGEARVEPSDEPNELCWSSSQWRDIRQSNEVVQNNHDQAILVGQEEASVPEEISTLKTLFPNFYASVPDAHPN